ncbi:hypothetical protein MHYP_G00063890 [Metynnis hypsauchen]
MIIFWYGWQKRSVTVIKLIDSKTKCCAPMPYMDMTCLRKRQIPHLTQQTPLNDFIPRHLACASTLVSLALTDPMGTVT